MRNTWIVEIQGRLWLLDGFLILHCFILIFKLFDYMLVNLRIDSIRIRLRNGLRNLQFILKVLEEGSALVVEPLGLVMNHEELSEYSCKPLDLLLQKVVEVLFHKSSKAKGAYERSQVGSQTTESET